MTRAAADEEIRHRPMCFVVAFIPAGCPADHLQGVVVALTDHVASRVGEAADDVDVTGGCGPVHRVGVVPLLARVDVEAARQQQLHGRQVSLVCRGMQQRPLVRLVARVELVRMFVEQDAQVADVAVSRRVEQLTVERQRIDVRLERPPAGESVGLRELELRVRQLCVRRRLPQFVELALCLLTEPIEVGVDREGHGIPSFL